MIFRTDLALEKQEALEDASPRGVLHAVKEEGGVRVTTICIRNEKGEQALGKPKGTYVTLEMPTPLTDKNSASVVGITLHISASVASEKITNAGTPFFFAKDILISLSASNSSGSTAWISAF